MNTENPVSRILRLPPDSVFEILGLTGSPSVDDIKKAYHALAKQVHPDKASNTRHANEAFKRLNAAYTTAITVVAAGIAAPAATTKIAKDDDEELNTRRSKGKKQPTQRTEGQHRKYSNSRITCDVYLPTGIKAKSFKFNSGDSLNDVLKKWNTFANPEMHTYYIMPHDGHICISTSSGNNIITILKNFAFSRNIHGVWQLLIDMYRNERGVESTAILDSEGYNWDEIILSRSNSNTDKGAVKSNRCRVSKLHIRKRVLTRHAKHKVASRH